MAEYIAREELLAQLRAMESYNVSPMYRRGYDDCVEAILKARAKYRVGCEKCGIYFWQLHEIQLIDGQPAVIKNGYDEAAEAWNRRATNGSN